MAKKKKEKKKRMSFFDTLKEAEKAILEIQRHLEKAHKQLQANESFTVEQTSVHGDLPGRRVGITDYHVDCIRGHFGAIITAIDEFEDKIE